MSTTEPQQDTTTEAAAPPETSGETQVAPEVTETPVDPQEGTPESPEIPDDTQLTAALRKARQEAADRRVAAREAQEAAETARAEAESLKARLSIVQDRWLSEKLFSTGVGIDAFKAAGHGAHNVLTEDGAIDAEKFAAAVTDTAERFGRIGRPGGIVPSAGTGNTRATPETNWASVLNPQ